MWVASTMGWFSIVRNTKETGTFLVRARERGDLVNLCRAAGLNQRELLDTPERDYRYRVVVGQDKLGEVFDALEDSITYPNFKAAVHETAGQEKKVEPYSRIWGLLADIQPTAPYSGRRGAR